MAGSLNRVEIIGNLGRDPEARASPSGSKIVNLAVATSESWTDKATGERKDKTEWHRVVIFNDRLADVAERFLRKGSKVYISGAMQTRKWTDKDGQERMTTEVVLSQFRGELLLLDARPAAEDAVAAAPSPAPAHQQHHAAARPAAARPAQRATSRKSDEPFYDDEVPF